MTQHYAKLASSPRLQKALRVLREADGEISNYELARKANIIAISSVISELRFNGFDISCRQVVIAGQRRFFYSLITEPEVQNG